MKKVGGFTAQVLKDTEIINGFQLINTTEKGLEIVDRRGLAQRLKSPVKGKGVLMQFGATHFIVTEKYYSELIK